jgi:tetratricopeptide (TPR) repeat protein
MKLSALQLIAKSKELYESKDYEQIINILDDDTLTEIKNSELCALKSKAYSKLKSFENAILFAERAIALNPSSASGYIARAEANLLNKLYEKCILDFDHAILLDDSLWEAFAGRGYCYASLRNYDKAIHDMNESIRRDKNRSGVYYNRGLVNHNLERYKEAISDFSKAIKLDSNNEKYLSGRGNSYFKAGLINKAKKDYLAAISINNRYNIPYLNLGIIYSDENKQDEAINNFTKGINIGDVRPRAFLLRARAYAEFGNYAEAIKDYEHFISIESDVDTYSVKLAKSQLIELKRKLDNSWYDDLDRTVSEIKNILLFEELCLTHFTSLSASQAMILEDSNFRLSEGNFLNDTSEGRELFKYLSYSTVDKINDDTLAKPFIERPFIGSFVDDSKHDDLTLWRMYGKEELTEAKGCALTINREAFIEALKKKLLLNDLNMESTLQQNTTFTFYKVAYRDNLDFKIPGSTKSKGNKLNKLMKSLKQQVSAIGSIVADQNENVAKLLNDIAYLFKTGDYQYENEVRLVVGGVGFTKKFHPTAQAPRVYIDLINIVPVLHKITLGPKVERPDEWAAAFNYKIDELEPNRLKKIEIVISRLPFK